MRPWSVPAPRLLLLSLLLVAACSGPSTPSTPAAAPSPAATAVPTRIAPPAHTTTPAYVLGSPLPLRADGFGQVLPTPVALRHRRLTAADVLAPPRDGRFHATISRVSPAVRSRMGDTYRAGCPVPVSQLRYLTLGFRGFDGRAHTGELVVAASAAVKTVSAFRALFSQGFPIEQMQLPTTEDLNAAPTGDGNDTAGFVCRAARGQTRFSAHAYGLAIDVNPFQNPFVRGSLVLPELASSYVARGPVRDGMFEPGSSAVRAFTDEGWTWGGTFSRPKDYQHFSLTGD